MYMLQKIQKENHLKKRLSKIISPLSGFSKRFKQRNNVDFPLPEEPIIVKHSPFSTEKEISFKTIVLFEKVLAK